MLATGTLAVGFVATFAKTWLRNCPEIRSSALPSVGIAKLRQMVALWLRPSSLSADRTIGARGFTKVGRYFSRLMICQPYGLCVESNSVMPI
jgi:hypothetical protein